MEGEMMPLSFLKAGDKASISHIGGSEEVRRRLGDLGFVVGGEIMVVSSDRGNMIVDVKGSRLALTSSMANHISV